MKKSDYDGTILFLIVLFFFGILLLPFYYLQQLHDSVVNHIFKWIGSDRRIVRIEQPFMNMNAD